uniref:Stage II sporulation protein M n=1 Tax=Acidianus brierleyi TaxID=41673 RepID=A0A2U9IDH1_9CREN
MRLLSKLILIFFGMELAIFLGVSSIPFYMPAVAQKFNSTAGAVDSEPYVPMVITIFSHNLMIALSEFIPIIGIGMLIYTTYSTGMVLSAFTTTVYHIPGIAAAVILLTLPHSWLELPSYAVAAGSGLYVILTRDWRRFVMMIPFVALELLMAASVESAEIYFRSVNSYYFWLAGAPLLVMLYLVYEYLQKKADILAPKPQTTTSVFIQGQPIQNQYVPEQNIVDQDLNAASVMENQGNYFTASQYYWNAIITLIGIVSKKTGFMPITLDDYFNAARLLGEKYSSEIPSLFDQAYKERTEGNFNEFRNTALSLITKLKAIDNIH